MNLFYTAAKQFANEDLSELMKKIKSIAKYKNTRCIDFRLSKDGDECLVAKAVFALSTPSGKHKECELQWEYATEDADSEDIYVSDDIDSLFALFKNMCSRSVTSSTRIVAADSGFGEETISDETFEDDIADLADNVEDLQDTVDEVQEDETNIDVDNNIEGHYIAECETCHGVFISAITESDQRIDKISGVCPVCEKETDQYLNWIIRKAEHDNEDT